MPTIMVTILPQLPKTMGCGNFETVSVRFGTAVSSTFVRHNIQQASRLFRDLVL
jgi:hypothetical protein